MKKSLWAIVAIFAVFALGFVSALAVRRPATVEVHTGPSAAMSIIVFLLAVLGLIAGLAVIAVVAWQVIRAREQTRRLEQAALLFGARNTPSAPRPARPAIQPGDRTVIVVGGQPPYLEDMRQ